MSKGCLQHHLVGAQFIQRSLAMSSILLRAKSGLRSVANPSVCLLVVVVVVGSG